MKTNKVFKSVVALALVLTMALATVLLQYSPADAAKTPKLNKSSVSVKVGDSSKVVVQNYVKGSTYVWTSSNKKVATVTPDAKPLKAYIKGVKPGKVTVTCKVTTPDSKNYTLKVPVTVQALPSKIALSAKTKDGKSLQLKESWKKDPPEHYYPFTVLKIDEDLILEYIPPSGRYLMGEVLDESDLSYPEIDLVHTKTWHRDTLSAEEIGRAHV